MTKALSLTVFAEHSNVSDGRTVGQTDRRTDGQNWYSNSRSDAARYALASVAKVRLSVNAVTIYEVLATSDVSIILSGEVPIGLYCKSMTSPGLPR